jgi:hypothetical protein
MASLRTQQQFLTIHGRQLHFVAYEEQAGNPRRGIEAVPAMWFMMAGSNRCPVMAYDPAQPEVDLTEALKQWAESNAFGPDGPPAAVVVDPARLERSRWEE